MLVARNVHTEILWRFNYKYPLVGFRLRKKERKNNNNNNKIATICLFCGFYLAYSCVSHAMFPCKREQPWIYFGGTLSVWISLFFPALCLSHTPLSERLEKAINKRMLTLGYLFDKRKQALLVQTFCLRRLETWFEQSLFFLPLSKRKQKNALLKGRLL